MLYEVIVTAFLGVFIVTYLLPLLSNYRIAKTSGFEVLICPINPHNPIWMIIGGVLAKTLSRNLPDSLWIRFRYALHGSAFLDRVRRLDAPSGALMLVSSGRTQLWIEDPELAQIILSRGTGVNQAVMTKQLLSIMGPNVFTSDGPDWQRHRRILTAALGVKIAKSVWHESIKQTGLIMQKLSGAPNDTTDQTMTHLRTLAMNVLTISGYGKGHYTEAAFATEQAKAPDSQYTLSYQEVLNALTQGFMLISILPIKILESKFMPQAVQTIASANREFPLYIKQLLQQERATRDTRTGQSTTFLGALVAMEEEHDIGKKKWLSEDEMQGELFVYTLAGFETTANTLGYAVAHLAVHPEWQNWIVQEIDEVVERHADPPQYETIFPELKRCLALMFETLRLYTPVENTSRTTSTTQSVTISSGTYIIPEKTNILLSFQYIHTKNAHWGSDAGTFRPGRWIEEDSSIATRTLVDVPAGVFMPWSAGARVCPGKLMAQSEFVATIFTLFRNFTVRPVVLEGETPALAAKRTQDVIDDSTPRLALSMDRPEDIKLVWQRRVS